LFSLSFIAGEPALLPTADSSPLSSTLTIAGLVDAEHVHSNGLPAKEALKAEFGVVIPQYLLDGAFAQFAGQRERRP
jgi:hypothetical protein